MKQLTCEMCGSVEIIKKDGVYVCQHCGTQYTVEEAKKLMVEGTVTFQISRDSEIPNLLNLAQVAHDGENAEDAVRYAEQILIIDATNAQAWAIKAMNLYRTLAVNGVNALTIKTTAKQAISLCEESQKTKLADEIVNRTVNHTLLVTGHTRDSAEIVQGLNICCELIEDIPEVSGNLVARRFDEFTKFLNHQDYRYIILSRWGNALFAKDRPDNRMKKLLDERYPGAYDAYTKTKQEEEYNRGQTALAQANFAGDFRVAALYFKNAGDYKDAKAMLERCKAEEKRHAEAPEDKKSRNDARLNQVITIILASLAGIGIAGFIVWWIITDLEILSILF